MAFRINNVPAPPYEEEKDERKNSELAETSPLKVADKEHGSPD